MNGAKWICYPQDFELYTFNKCMTRRFERDTPIPPFWRMDNCQNCVRFFRDVDLSEPAEATVKADGLLNVSFDDFDSYECVRGGKLILKRGKYRLIATVAGQGRLPAFYLDSPVLKTDGNWRVTCNDKRDYPASVLSLSADIFPSDYRLPVRAVRHERIVEYRGKKLYDFGRELVGYVRLSGCAGKDLVVCYGESPEEAADFSHCEQIDRVPDGAGEWTAPVSKAFRYVAFSDCSAFSDFSVLEEYADVVCAASFESSDGMLDRIFDTSVYTLYLNTREFFLDGVKRDRWVWSGDATQSYLMNYYSFNANETVRRTMLALLGKPPYLTHINHIVDYTFFWIRSFYDYYLYTGDLEFIRDNYERIRDMAEFCIGRADGEGLIVGYPEDWVFIDWAEKTDNSGAVAAEQMLYSAALSALACFAGIFGKTEDERRYGALASASADGLRRFWDEKEGRYVYNLKEGVPSGAVTKHPNIFAVLFGFCGEKEREGIRRALLGSDLPKITTPYMRFYELAALCELGEYEYVLGEIRRYWGGMLAEGATTFWEAYDPGQTGPEKYAMYGRPYGKSLCHAWGAGPLYLLARYFAGLRPASPGYKSYIVEPHLAGLGSFRATFPAGKDRVEIAASERDGVLRIEIESGTDGKLILGNGRKTIDLPGGRRHVIEEKA